MREPGGDQESALHANGLVTSGGVLEVQYPGISAQSPSVSDFALGNFVFGPATLPSAVPSLLGSYTQAASLVGLAPSPTLVNSVWGMNFTAEAGQLPIQLPSGAWATAYARTAAPQTQFAVGNLTTAKFTSEKIVGAGAVFGIAGATAFPVTDSPKLTNYPLQGVSAGPAARPHRAGN